MDHNNTRHNTHAQTIITPCCTFQHVLCAPNTQISLDTTLLTNKQEIYMIHTIDFNKQINKYYKISNKKMSYTKRVKVSRMYEINAK